MKRLPFSWDIPLTTYNCDIAKYGVMMTNPEAIKSIYTGNVIPYLYLSKSYDMELGYYCFNYGENEATNDFLADNKPPIIIEQIGLNKNEEIPFEEKKVKLINLIKSIIDDNKYVHGWWDEYYVPRRIFYNNRHFSHEFLFIGYDDVGFYVVGYDEKSCPNECTVSFDDFYTAINSIGIDHVFSWEVNDNFKYDISLKHIYDAMDLYVESKIYNFEKRDYSKYLFGMNAFLKMAEIYEEINDQTETWVGIRFFHTFKEHKNLMYKRIKYIYETYGVEYGDSDLSRLKEISDEADAMYLLCVKFRLNNNISDARKIAGHIRYICQNERDLYPIISSKLKKITC